MIRPVQWKAYHTQRICPNKAQERPARDHKFAVGAVPLMSPGVSFEKEERDGEEEDAGDEDGEEEEEGDEHREERVERRYTDVGCVEKTMSVQSQLRRQMGNGLENRGIPTATLSSVLVS